MIDESATRDRQFMRLALAEAEKGWGATHPNPMVGAVIVEDGAVVAAGYHEAAGLPHAERVALDRLGRRPAVGATLYCTLEPCSTTGRTSPCTNAILESGIRRVVIGATDPNPRHAGRGLEILRAAGLEVVEGVEAESCRDLNLIFNHWITHAGAPFIAGKLALTLDGKIAASNGHSKWITGGAARADVMRWRRLFPAIGVGADTVLFDDPQLTSRPEGGEPWCPRRLVFDPQFRTVTDPLPGLYSDAWAERTVVVSSDPPAGTTAAALARAGVETWALGPAPDDPAYYPALGEALSAAGLNGLFLEGGGKLISRFLNAGALHYLFTYKAPKILGDSGARPGFEGRAPRSMEQAIRLRDVRYAILGEDVLTRGFLEVPGQTQPEEAS